MTIIVTGGAGFIGSNFIFHMLNKYPDYRIICLDCLTYAGNLSTLEPVMDNPNFRFVKESITDRDAVYKLFEEEHPDMVVNFAAESHVDRSVENPGVFLHTNIIGTQVLMDACRKTAEKILSKGSYAVSLAKSVINAGQDMDLSNGLKMEADAFGFTFSTHDKREGMTAFLEKRPAELTDF